MKWLKTAVLIAALGNVVACAGTLQSASAGQTGCSPSEITISDDTGVMAPRTWTAHCSGKKFTCTAEKTNLLGDVGDVSCKERPDENTNTETAAPPQTVGCQYDAQCKGDRICVDGKCVNDESGQEASEQDTE